MGRFVAGQGDHRSGIYGGRQASAAAAAAAVIVVDAGVVVAAAVVVVVVVVVADIAVRRRSRALSMVDPAVAPRDLASCRSPLKQICFPNSPPAHHNPRS